MFSKDSVQLQHIIRIIILFREELLFFVVPCNCKILLGILESSLCNYFDKIYKITISAAYA